MNSFLLLVLISITAIFLSGLYFVRFTRFKSKVPPVRAFKDVLIAVTSAALTAHALNVEQNIRLEDLNNLPLLGGVYLVLHFALVAWLAFYDLGLPVLRIPSYWAVLFLYSSYLYFRSFSFPEYGLSTPILQIWIIGIAWFRWRSSGFRFAIQRPLFYAIGLWLLWSGVASLFSSDRGSSLTAYFDVVCSVLAALLIAEDFATESAWKAAVRWVVLTAGVLFGVLSFYKFIVLSLQLGIYPATHYRLFIADVGPNWIAHSVSVVFPLTFVFFLETQGWRKWAWLAGGIVMLFAIIYTQSSIGISGYLSLAVEGIVLFVLFKRKSLIPWLRKFQKRLIYISCVVVAVGAVALFIFISLSRNSYSVNGRLFIWDTVMREIGSHPILGVGFGVRYTNSQSASNLVWEDRMRQVPLVQNDPLAQLIQKQQLKAHAHNVFLEIAHGSGIPAALAFLWFLWELGRYIYPFLIRDHPFSPYLYGCAAGVVGAISWGMIDVMEYTPLFFTFPVWGLVGLLLAIPSIDRAAAVNHAGVAIGNGNLLFARQRPGTIRILGILGILILCVLVAPFIGNIYYQNGFAYFQSRQWDEARRNFVVASRLDPFNAKYQEFLGLSYINLDAYDDALQAYEKAASLKRGYSPYLDQMGWLYWLNHDLERAAQAFQEAIDADPREVWKSGLHADLGLLLASQGREKDAIDLFKISIELSPEIVMEPYWVKLIDPNGNFDAVIHSAYLVNDQPADAPDNQDLRGQILYHLGRADVTSRHLRPSADPSSPVSLSRVLDAIEEDYQKAKENHQTGEAQGLLAILAKASEWAGFNHRAIQAYQFYEKEYRASAFGFRELSLLYLNEGYMDQARSTIGEAVSVYPRDGASWLALADISIRGQDWITAQQALEKSSYLQPTNVENYQLQSQLFEDQGDFAKAAALLEQTVLLSDALSQRIHLVNLYLKAGWTSEVEMNSSVVLDRITREKVRSLDPLMWETGQLLAKLDDAQPAIERMKNRDPYTAAVLSGYAAQNQSKLSEAEKMFQDASHIRPKEAVPHYLLGQVYAQMEQYSEAQTEYHKAFDLNPYEPQPMMALGKFLWNRGDVEGALESYRTAVSAAPGWDEAYTALGNIYLFQKDNEKAVQQYDLATLSAGIREGEWFHFADALPEAELQSPGPNFIYLDTFAINGDRRQTLFMHPDSQASFSLRLPVSKTIDMKFAIGMMPESWTQEGDGVRFVVRVGTGTSETQLYSEYTNPKQQFQDRAWKDGWIDLSSYGGQEITITLETQSGPANDNRFDWAGWGDPVLVIRPAP